jgi:hypothetical protein
MGAALLVVPALAIAWLWAAPRARVRGLLAGAAAMVVAGGAWPLLVALTPASSRPWISGTSDNSIWSLIIDYNGLGRLDGQAGGPQGMGGGGPGGGAGVFGGSAGPLRLLNDALGGQAGWLLGFALVAGLALAVSTRLSRRDPATGWILAAGGCALTAAVAFSSAKGIFHPYYVSELAPFTAALVGAGAVRFTRGDLLARVAGPLAIAGGVITELIVLSSGAGSLDWLPPVLVVVGILAASALAVGPSARARNAGIAAAATTLLIAPAAWSVETLGHPASGTFPAGGPADAGGGFGGPGGGFGGGPRGGGTFGGPNGGTPGSPPAGANGGTPGTPPGAPGGVAPGSNGGSPGATTRRGGFGGGRGGLFGGNSAALTSALAYIKANGGGTLAVSSQSTAAAAIIASDANIVGLGGFSGRETEVSVSWLADQVRAGKVRWALSDGAGGGGLRNNDGRTGSTTALAAVAATCKQVDANGVTFYDCQGLADEIAAA